MSNIDQIMKASAQAGHEVKPIGAFGCFNATSGPVAEVVGIGLA
jgi:hypothetical protein